MDESKYRAMLVEIGAALGEKELKAMKFMCSDIPRGAKEDIDSGIDLWKALEERDKLSPSNLNFLKELLEKCTEKRTDLLNILKKYTSPGQGTTSFLVTSGTGFQPISVPQGIYTGQQG